MAISWAEFERAAPELAAAAPRLIYAVGSDGPGLGHLARDGSYALHVFPGRDDDESFCCAGPARWLAPRTPATRPVYERWCAPR